MCTHDHLHQVDTQTIDVSWLLWQQFVKVIFPFSHSFLFPFISLLSTLIPSLPFLISSLLLVITCSLFILSPSLPAHLPHLFFFWAISLLFNSPFPPWCHSLQCSLPLVFSVSSLLSSLFSSLRFHSFFSHLLLLLLFTFLFLPLILMFSYCPTDFSLPLLFPLLSSHLHSLLCLFPFLLAPPMIVILLSPLLILLFFPSAPLLLLSVYQQ